MIDIPLLVKNTALPKNFTDVIYLTDQGHMPTEIRQLVRQKRLSYSVLPIAQSPELRQRSHLIGTVILDAADLGTFEHQDVGRIIQAFEQDSVGVIVLTHRVKQPVRSFSLSPTKSSFSMADSVESVSIDDLWVQISVNLACRKKSSGIMSRPMVSASKLQRTDTNKLAEQLQMTSTLVENLTEQLRLAGLVQRDFLPSKLPDCENYSWATTFFPAEWVSGDIYDVARLDERHIGFYIVDAVGHGMPAALLTIFVKQALTTQISEGDDSRLLQPSEVMSRLNVKMSQEKLSGYQFATCCYCLLNTETRELTYARAGHPYPLLARPGRPLQQLEIRGSLLGVFEQAEYPEQTVQLEPGDKIILYSDGAEPFIGNLDDSQAFTYYEDFLALIEQPVVEMLDNFAALTKRKKIDPGSFDDITMVGLEVQ